VSKGRPRLKAVEADILQHPDLRRAVQTLMYTDDYSIVAEDYDSATLIYSHGDPPQPRITLTVAEP
jgi:hypothetical protein